METRKQHPVRRYFADMWAGISTTWVGMWLTFRYFWSKPTTLRYPEVKPVIPPGHRGLHVFEESKCGACRICARQCPVDCITFQCIGMREEALIISYDVDYSKCLFCNLCAEVCPTSCVRLSEKYDLACGSRDDCILHLARPKSDEEIAEKKAALARKQAEEQAKPPQG